MRIRRKGEDDNAQSRLLDALMPSDLPDWYRRKPRKRIGPEDTVPLGLSGRERELIADETFAPAYLTNRLRLVPVGEKRPAASFTLDDWEELHGYVAAAANHCKNRKLEDELYRICERVQEILDTHTDQGD